jgi:O-antigen/teichoic acid export membrane protein
MNFKNIKTLFFENIGIKQTIFKNTFWLAVAEGIPRLLEFVLIIYITRILGATEFGKFTFALAFVSMFVVLSDFGLSDITTRELSRDKESEKEYSGIISLKILLSIGTLILMLIGSFFITPDPIIRKVIWILAIFVLISNFFLIIYAFLRARQRMEYEAGIKIFQALIIFSIVLFILFRFPSIENISRGYLIANLITSIVVLMFFHFYIYPLHFSFDRNIWQKFFRFSWPLGLAAISGATFISIDSVMMGYFGQITQTGWYNAARRIVGLTVIPATLILMSFYPVLSKLFRESKEKLQKVWNYYMESMIILAIPIVGGGLALAPKIINFIYAPNFSPSILAFQILIFAAGINFLYNPYIMMLVVSNQQKKYLWINLIAAVINIILNLILIPRYSLYGAAIAAVITYIVILFLGVEFSRRFTPISPFNSRLFKTLTMTILSSSIMFIAITQSMVHNLNVLLTIIIGILIYFAFLFLFYKFSYKFNLLTKNL